MFEVALGMFLWYCLICYIICACNCYRLDGHRMLEMLRGKRLIFVGDSINRNMWESLICILRNSVKDKSKVYEANGRVHFRGEASYSFIFKVNTKSFYVFNFSFSGFYLIIILIACLLGL